MTYLLYTIRLTMLVTIPINDVPLVYDKADNVSDDPNHRDDRSNNDAVHILNDVPHSVADRVDNSYRRIPG